MRTVFSVERGAALALMLALGCSAHNTLIGPPGDAAVSSNDTPTSGTDARVHADVSVSDDAPATTTDTGVSVADSGPPSGSNVVSVIVDEGPAGVDSIDELYVSITFCRPGTTMCQTVDHIIVDTGSSGLRVLSDVLDPSLMLPNATAGAGSGTLAECAGFADGYTWGPIATADIQIGGETAHNVAVQVIGDPNFTYIPSDCTSQGMGSTSPGDLGGNGLLGIGNSIQDCGDYCADPRNPAPGNYYGCSGSRCTVAVVADSAQVLNPVSLFPTDNNGLIIQMPSIDPAGVMSVSGSMIFGIGTQSNNGLGSATVLTVDDLNGYFTTTFNGESLPQSFIDSGTNTYAFDDSSIPQCNQDYDQGFDCPSSRMMLSAQNTGLNGMVTSVTFSVDNAGTIFDSNVGASDSLATPAIQDGSFDWGLPFFFGRSIYVAMNGVSTPGGPGPYVAY